MDDLLSEQQQIEAIRSWWNENGRYVLSGIVIGVGVLFGWHYWQDHQRTSRLEASALYESLLTDVASTKVKPAEAKAARLLDDYGATAYAQQGRLAMSRLYMDVGRDEDAAQKLRDAVAADPESAIAMVARLRLARILLYQEKPEEVVELLSGYRNSAFAARYSEALGDAYAAEKKYEDAAAAYSTALADDPNTPTVDRTLVQMKIDDLPGVPGDDAAVNTEGAVGTGTPGQASEAPDDKAQATPPQHEPSDDNAQKEPE